MAEGVTGGMTIRAASGSDLEVVAGLAGSRDRAGDRAAIAFYERLGYVVAGPHEHHWRAIDPRTGTVTGGGRASTWIMRRTLGGPT